MVTVLITTYNGSDYIKETIESVLSQTYKDFEFILVDDCSKDSTVDIIKSFDDPRIKLIQNEHNLGISGASNVGLAAAKGKYIVRCDQDDISLPDRIQKQVEFMEAHPEIGASGTWYREFGGHNRVKRNIANAEKLSVALLRGCYIQHPTSILRKSVLDDYGITYRENLRVANDYALWLDMLGHCKLANIPEILFKYRIHKKQTGARFSSAVSTEFKFARKEFFKRYESDISDVDIDLFSDFLIDGRLDVVSNPFEATAHVVQKIIRFNKKHKIWDSDCLTQFFTKMWRKRAFKNMFKFGGYFRSMKILKDAIGE